MNHLAEWKASCVDEELTQLNVIPLEGSAASEYLLYSDAIPRRNDGRISEGFLQRYAHTDAGGWWCSGIDILTGEEDVWGCFKPDRPRRNCNHRRQKTIKYEHPPKTPTGLFALKVTLGIWEKIARRYKMDILPTDIDRDRADMGFWQWFIVHPEIPLCITEGAKKAGALLSAGYSAIALPGINNGYRTPKDRNGNRIGSSHLIPQLQKLATGNREIYIVFDRDTKPNTVKAVNAAIKKTGYLLQKSGCQVKVVEWNPQLGKGVDDLIANNGQKAFDEAYDNALCLETWKAKSWRSLTYTTQVQTNCRYLSELDIPLKTQLIGIKSPKGTGKTKFFENIVARAIDNRQKVLVIGHRVQLVQELCQRFGLKYITEVVRPRVERKRSDPQGVCAQRRDAGASLASEGGCSAKDASGSRPSKGTLTKTIDRQSQSEILGYGLCIDSLHRNSQAQFNADDWSDSVVIIDEVEQVLWHGLNSTTCKDNRVEILKSLKTLMQNVLAKQGQVYVADADLSDISLDYLISLSGIDIQPYIIQNDWKPDKSSSWQVYNYSGKTPKKLVADLEKHIQQGGKPFVCLSAQKLTSKWGTQTLEAYLKQKFPTAKILRIDSESLADPNHSAYKCIAKLERVLINYDIVLASPSIETGVSIELQNHFTSVWAIAQGIQGENTVRQTLARLRHNIPRYLWCANYSFNKIGNGSTSIPALLSSNHRLTQLNIRLLQQSDFSDLDDLDTGFQAESLLCWAKMAVRFNAGASDYRNSILSGLREEGHQIIDAATINIEKQETNSLVEAITEISEQNYQAECKAIAASPNLSETQYQTLKKRPIKSLSDRRQLKKYELKQRYHLPITSELVTLDDNGWYDKIRLHYFLTVGRPYLADRDTKVARKLIEQGNGSLFLPDFNNSQLGAIVGTMEILGIPTLLQDTDRQLRNTDPELQALAAIALNNRREIKTILGIGIAKNSSAIAIISRLLGKIDFKLKCVRYESAGKKRIRVYQIVKPTDLREQVFQHWLEIDRHLPGNSIFWSEQNIQGNLNSITNVSDDNYLQLSLNI